LTGGAHDAGRAALDGLPAGRDLSALEARGNV